jgi:Na+-transporting NADH:ubiquinone oxidoreductase subunit D
MAQSPGLWTIPTAPPVRETPVTLQMLGPCSALAVTTSPATALTVVPTLSAGLISAIRAHIPDTIQLIVQIVIDQVLQAFLFEIGQALSVHVARITTNCLVPGRIGAFARRNPPVPAMVDAFGNGPGYSLIPIVIGAVRELFGRGQIVGVTVLPPADEGGWFTPLSPMLLAPRTFFLLGMLVWAIRSVGTEQVRAQERAE